MARWPSKWIPRTRNTLYLIVIAYTLVALIVLGWQPDVGWALIVMGVAWALFVILRYQPSTGLFGISTDCAKCGAALTQHAGLPARNCASCGDTQPWAKSLRREED